MIKKLTELKYVDIVNVNLVSSSITMINCRLEGTLLAGEYYDDGDRIVIFKEPCIFGSSTFVKEANFERTIFNNRISFWRTSFNSETNFKHAHFNSSVDFNYTNFNNRAYFEDVNFNEEAYFDDANFNDRVHFEGANFNGGAYFRNADFREVAILNPVTFSSKTIDLRLARYSELQISWPQLKGRLDYKHLTKNITEWQGVYLKLINNFKNIGDTVTADDVYYYYRYEKSKLGQGGVATDKKLVRIYILRPYLWLWGKTIKTPSSVGRIDFRIHYFHLFSIFKKGLTGVSESSEDWNSEKSEVVETII